MEIINKDFGSELKIKLDGKDVTLHIFSMNKDQIKFGIEAANSIQINREEVLQKRQIEDNKTE